MVKLIPLTFSSNGDQFDALGLDELKRLVHIGDLMKTHATAVRTWECLSGNHLQQEHQLESIAEVFLDALDLSPSLAEVTVAPRSESLKLQKFVNLASK
ncbi:hypothetical protein L596_022507 [Steinernema carpocapsae]|uniref:Uncharacterized protein n=1 Tax=Steinernema carpocapsae TaxID=34508 RepID=A0A4U5MMS5_STECR|nr:hypothetical protein L596_022507 [Steinernema carpocapsae]